MIFDLQPEYFNHQSEVHGIMHTYRVMHNVLLLSSEHNFSEQQFKTAYCAAFIHDMARTHDGYCTQHGEWAVKEKLHLFENDFKNFGLSDALIEEIKTSVTYHSLHQELDKAHPHYIVTALLKDADALDRIRLGFPGLDPEYLRIQKSKSLIEVAERNYFLTEKIICKSWNEFSEIIKTDSRENSRRKMRNIFQRIGWRKIMK